MKDINVLKTILSTSDKNNGDFKHARAASMSCRKHLMFISGVAIAVETLLFVVPEIIRNIKENK